MVSAELLVASLDAETSMSMKEFNLFLLGRENLTEEEKNEIVKARAE